MKKYGILAYPAGHSLSPAIHNAAFKAARIEARYEVFEISPRLFKGFMKKVRDENISGLSVSLPYKEKILPYLDKIDKDAMRIGAVNTVVNKNGILYGYNTDFIGAIKALKEKMPHLKNKWATVVGAGGAARAICYGLLKEGANVRVVNRTKSKAAKIAMDFAEIFSSEIHSGGIGKRDKLYLGDILIHASSFWFKGKIDWEIGPPDFADYFYVDKFKLIMDISYNVPMRFYEDPLMTPLIENARLCKKKFITGDRMLLYQAIEQFHIWTGKKAPIKIMAKALYRHLEKKRKLEYYG